MLKEFRVENFKSIKDEQIFTMEACPKNEVSEYPEHVVEFGKERLLKVSSMYGPNGGGKSNLIKALTIFGAVTLNNIVLNDSIRDENYYPSLFLKNKTTKFTLFFIHDGYEIGYSLEVDLNNVGQFLNTSTNSTHYVVDYRIVSEEMVSRLLEEEDFKVLFTRNKEGIISSNVVSDIDLIKNKTPLNNNLSFVKYYCSTFMLTKNNDNARPLYELFNEINSYVLLKGETRVFKFLKNNVEQLTPYLDKAKEYLNVLDFRIESLYFKEVEPGVSYLYIRRKAKEGQYTDIPIQNESKGTIKAVNVVLAVLSGSNRQLYLADDFDSFLHPKLIKVIIDLFTSSENNSKQLIFNSHDIVNMNNNVFRRDEIWFAYRNEEYSTIYKPLSNIVDYKGNMVRKDAVYGKQYLEGRYGADPFIEKGLSWRND